MDGSAAQLATVDSVQRQASHAPHMLLALPAPAKLNLFLHVTGRRADGYHELQTAFTLIDLSDLLDFERRPDGAIVREGDLAGAPDDDLAVRAARKLQHLSGTSLGATIGVSKRIPPGSGMGGGSSDAATTLLALNRLWDLQLPRAELSKVALQLGADVPFFLHGRSAFAESIGEHLTTIELPPAWYAIVWPELHVSTREIFNDERLTRNSKVMKIAAFSPATAATATVNDLEPVARRRYPIIDEAIRRLERFGAARMTGSGSAVFAAMASRQLAQAAVADMPPTWRCWVVQGLDEHPLSVW